MGVPEAIALRWIRPKGSSMEGAVRRVEQRRPSMRSSWGRQSAKETSLVMPRSRARVWGEAGVLLAWWVGYRGHSAIPSVAASRPPGALEHQVWPRTG